MTISQKYLNMYLCEKNDKLYYIKKLYSILNVNQISMINLLAK